eukprot:3486851-Alexandrium_andersonii.AAC.1
MQLFAPHAALRHATTCNKRQATALAPATRATMSHNVQHGTTDAHTQHRGATYEARICNAPSALCRGG